MWFSYEKPIPILEPEKYGLESVHFVYALSKHVGLKSSDDIEQITVVICESFESPVHKTETR